MSKHKHVLTVNKIGRGAKKYNYSFGHTKNIELVLSKTGFSVSAVLTKRYNRAEVLSERNYLFSDALKKALLQRRRNRHRRHKAHQQKNA